MASAAAAPNHKLATPFEASTAMCPKCNQPVRRISVNSGSFFMTCPNRISIDVKGGRPGEKRSDHCGQKLHVLAADGVAFVAPVSEEAFRKYHRTYPTAATVYGELGIIVLTPRASPDEIPKYKCLGCGELTPLYDLYGGRCRATCAKLADHVEPR
jgi:hypothetical protein